VNFQPPRAGLVKAGRVFAGHPQGWVLTGPRTAARLIGRGSWSGRMRGELLDTRSVSGRSMSAI
jgi:hypothetical protein